MVAVPQLMETNMRLLSALVALTLAGCAQPPPLPPMSAAATAAALDPGFSDRGGSAWRGGASPAAAPQSHAERDAQAAAICAARAEMAGATYSGRGFGLAGAIGAGMEAGIAAERVRAVCLDAYRRTGVLPSF